MSKDVEKQSIEITIFDITGKLILTDKVLSDSAEIEFKNSLLNGTYLLKVKFEDGSFDMHRLIISK